jgi:hypothetical protein
LYIGNGIEGDDGTGCEAAFLLVGAPYFITFASDNRLLIASLLFLLRSLILIGLTISFIYIKKNRISLLAPEKKPCYSMK